MFVTLAFDTLCVDKLTAEVQGWNWEQFRSGEGVFFDVEGVRRKHDYFMGEKWDRHVLAIFREKGRAIESAIAFAIGCLDVGSENGVMGMDEAE